MFKVLRKQKKALDTMVESVNTSTRQLMVMEREMDMMQHGTNKVTIYWYIIDEGQILIN